MVVDQDIPREAKVADCFINNENHPDPRLLESVKSGNQSTGAGIVLLRSGGNCDGLGGVGGWALPRRQRWMSQSKGCFDNVRQQQRPLLPDAVWGC